MVYNDLGIKIIASNYIIRYTMSAILLIAGICAISYGLYFDDRETIYLGASLAISSFISFVILRFIINRMSSYREIQELRDREIQRGTPSVSTIFGAKVYEIPYFSCNKCGNHRFDVHSDESGMCSSCGEVYSKINITTESQFLGRRTKFGKIE